MKHVSLVPTLEQLGPGVRMWSDAIGITGEAEDFTGQDRRLLSNSTVAEELVDEEVLLQVTTETAGPTMAPHLITRLDRMDSLNYMNAEEDVGLVEVEIEEEEEWMGLNVPDTMNGTEMVEGWLEGSEEAQPQMEEEADHCSRVQVAAKVGPTTAFASYLARLQAHFESMTKQQSANVIHFLYQKLEEWRGEWIMALTWVSRDRADRLWALLVTYQGEPSCIVESDKRWAESRWQEVVEMLQIDAAKAANVGENQSGVIKVEDTQQAPASSSGDVLVQRRPGEPWEQATKDEREELARHDEAVREEEERQAEHDEWLWQNHRAAEARSWDEWAMRTELEGSTRQRPLKRFRVKIAVTDSEYNELAVADLKGEVDISDVPQVNVIVQERVIQVPVQAEMEEQHLTEGDNATKGGLGEDAREADQAETVAAASPVGELDEIVDENMSDLGSDLGNGDGQKMVSAVCATASGRRNGEEKVGDNGAGSLPSEQRHDGYGRGTGAARCWRTKGQRNKDGRRRCQCSPHV